MTCWTFTLALFVLVASCWSQKYELDQDKLQQRYNLIQILVAKGVPGKSGYGAAKHKPTIGAAYGHNQKVGYYGGNSYAPTYGGYNLNTVQGAGRNYGNYRAGNYGASNYGGNYGGNNYGPLIYKPGGGVYHPLFNNNNLYKPVQTYDDKTFSEYDTKEPIYIGSSKTGGLYGQSGYRQQPAGYAQPQLSAYGARPPSYTGKDVGGAPYTGQKDTLYSNLPGYSNPYFSKY